MLFDQTHMVAEGRVERYILLLHTTLQGNFLGVWMCVCGS